MTDLILKKNEKARLWPSFFVAVAFLGWIGCQGAPEQDFNNEVRVPGWGLIESCAGEPVALETCTWADSLDGLVFGRVVEVDFIQEPAFLVGTMELVDCPSQASPALSVRLQVLESYAGDLAEGEVLHFFIGRDSVTGWWPGHEYDTHSGFYWPEGVGLSVGQFIGVPYHLYEPTDQYTLNWERLFWFEEESLRHQEGGYCDEPFPGVLRGLSPTQFRQALESCDGSSESGQARAAEIREDWERRARPPQTIGALCYRDFDEDPGFSGPCTDDVMCEVDEICMDGECIVGNCHTDRNCAPTWECIENQCVHVGGGNFGGGD